MDWEAIELLILTIFSIACLIFDIYRSYKIKRHEDDEIPDSIKTSNSDDWPY